MITRSTLGHSSFHRADPIPTSYQTGMAGPGCNEQPEPGAWALTGWQVTQLCPQNLGTVGGGERGVLTTFGL